MQSPSHFHRSVDQGNFACVKHLINPFKLQSEQTICTRTCCRRVSELLCTCSGTYRPFSVRNIPRKFANIIIDSLIRIWCMMLVNALIQSWLNPGRTRWKELAWRTKICDDTWYLSKVRNAWNGWCSEDADGKNPVCNLSNTIFTIGKSIRAFRLILHGGAL